MEICINGSPMSHEFNNIATLEDLLCTLSEKALPADHIIGDVTVDGTLFSERYPGESRHITAETIQRVDIKTVSVEQLARAALKDGSIFVDRIVQSITHSAELFRMHDEIEAHEYYIKLLDALRAFFSFITATKKAINWDFSSSFHNAESIQDEWDRIVSLIDELQKIQEEGDLILMADLLEYELLPAVQMWGDIFKKKCIQ